MFFSHTVAKKFYRYNAFNVYRRELAPGTVSLTGDRAQGDDSKHWANSIYFGVNCFMGEYTCLIDIFEMSTRRS